MAQERDNVKAGLFVLVGIVLAVGVIFALSDFERLFEKRQSVKAYYRVGDGLLGLKAGATVTLGDQPIGNITRIDDFLDPAGRAIGKIVTFSIPRRYKIFQDAVIELNAPPLGSGTKLNIRSVGSETPYDGTKPIDGSIASSQLTKNLMADAGIADLQREQIRNIIAHVEAISGKLREDVPKISASVLKTLDKAQPLLDDAQKAVADLKETSAHAKAVLADVRQRSGPWFDRIDGITTSANDTLARVNTLVKDKDPALRTIVDNVKDISQQARDKTMVQVTEALDKAGAAMENLKKTTAELQAFVVGQRPVLEHMMANFELSSDQLKLAAIEVRRSPWRLLYSPSDEELTTDNLYDAARSFALAAGTLDAASKSLAAVAEKNPDQEQVKQMVGHLEALFKRYQEAEESFWKALKSAPGKGTPVK